MNPKNLKEIIDELIALGEDKEELSYWQTLFPFLPEDKKILLASNLKQELRDLTDARDAKTA